MSKVQRIEAELQTLSLAELRQVCAWLDDILEDELEFTDEFEAKVRASEQDMAAVSELHPDVYDSHELAPLILPAVRGSHQPLTSRNFSQLRQRARRSSLRP